QYRYGTRDYIAENVITKDTISIKDFMEFVSSENPRTKLKFALQQQGRDTSMYPPNMLNSNYFPTRFVKFPVDKAAVLKNGIVKEKDADKIVDNIVIEIKGSAIYKNRLLMLDIIAN